MKVTPVHDRLLVRRIEDKVQEKGGIVIPDSAREKPMEAKVIAIGSGRVLEGGKKEKERDSDPGDSGRGPNGGWLN